MAEPEVREFTILLTDVVGGVTRWGDDESASSHALAEHDSLLWDLINTHGGIAIKRSGGGRWARFAQPRAAVDAALAIQHAFRHKKWEGVGALQVRVALDVGPVIIRDGDASGTTMNQVSRLADAAGGGEILASAAVIELVQHDLPAGVTLMSLGELRLRGLPAYQIVPAPDAPRSIQEPATAALGTPPAGTLLVFTLGTFRIEGNGQRVEQGSWGRTTGRQVFKWLITRMGRYLSRDESHETFWPESTRRPPRTTCVVRSMRCARRSTHWDSLAWNTLSFGAAMVSSFGRMAPSGWMPTHSNSSWTGRGWHQTRDRSSNPPLPCITAITCQTTCSKTGPYHGASGCDVGGWSCISS